MRSGSVSRRRSASRPTTTAPPASIDTTDGTRAVPAAVANDDGAVLADERNQAVGGAEVDADDFGHGGGLVGRLRGWRRRSGSRCSSAPAAGCGSTRAWRAARRAAPARPPACPTAGTAPPAAPPGAPPALRSAAGPRRAARSICSGEAPASRAARISSSSSLSANISSSTPAGSSCASWCRPTLGSPSSFSRYSARSSGCRSTRYASFRYDARSRLATRSWPEAV